MADSDPSAHTGTPDQGEFDWYRAWLNDPDVSEEARWVRMRNHETPPALEDVMQWWAWDGPSNSERAAVHVAAPLLALYFQRDKDARHVWAAYRAIRGAGLKVPESVLGIFDAWADALEEADGMAQIAAALDLPRKQGRFAGSQHARDMRKSVRIVKAISSHLTRLKLNATRDPSWSSRATEEAIRLVARDMRVSTAAVKGHWSRWQRSCKAASTAPAIDVPTLESAWRSR
ncbi:hypothetical protein ACU6VI_10605 [Sphaerotilus natans]|uniref:hypothetical protein n=1 Tax=Sphaerotilus natans TaxID=34103 RepID=UPI00406C1ACC